MKVGLFFGSFNPIHTGHLVIASHMADFHVDKIWFVVSPQNPFKQPRELLYAEARLALVKLAIEKDERFEVSDIEFQLHLPSYTINTLQALTRKHSEYEFFIIMGSDNLLDVSKWKSSGEIIKNYNLLIYKRPGFSITNQNLPMGSLVANSPFLDISSTEIRNLIIQGKSIKYLVPEIVCDSIEQNNYFK